MPAVSRQGVDGVNERPSGSVVDGKYEIVERLAAGGMGEVFRARHVHLHEDRVLKILRADKATDPQAVQRFVQEARIATQIKHPNVAILYDFSRLDDGSFYMVWEHIAGEDVGSRIQNEGPLPVPMAIEIAIQSLRGLDAIHSAGVIHRDISPDNLMLTRDRRGKPEVKIIDLGLAKNLQAAQASEITQAGMFMGKLMYCSPEQAGSIGTTPLDHRSDLYSLAAVVYEMVTGKPPFDSENAHGYVLKRLSEAPLPMRDRTAGVRVPALLEQVVMRGLERDREKRWPDAIAFLQALVHVSDQLRKVSTQEIPEVKAGGDAAATPPRPATSSPRSGPRATPSELSREERLDLLAQIDRAARRVSEATRLVDEAQAALTGGQTDEAAERIARLESVSPRHASLRELQAALSAHRRAPASGRAPVSPPQAAAPAAAAPAAAAPAAPAPATPAARPVEQRRVPPKPTPEQEEQRARIAETEKLLEGYIREHKQSLARFALETLLDLMPNHPRRGDYEAWVNLMGEEVEQLHNAESMFAAGREEILRGELDSARRRLAEIDEADPSHKLAASFRHELEEAERSRRSDVELDRRRERLEELLDSRRLAEAEQELERLSGSGLARVSVESYRLRLSDIAALALREANAQGYEKRYRERVQAHDWSGAREVVYEFERAAPDSPRPAQLFAEISRLEQIRRRQQGIEQGVQQLEVFLGQRKLAEAEMALKIILQMAPDLPQREKLERRVEALRQGA
jgi:serine/threonine protein kinase